MSENEKKLRTWLKQYGERGLLVEAPEGILDAILAEHRAEVEGHQSLADALRERLRATGAPFTNRGIPGMVDDALSAARDAALEEAALELEDGPIRTDDDGRLLAGSEAIRALKSQPAPATQARCECGHLDDIHHSRGGCATCGCMQYRPPLPSSQPARLYVDAEKVRTVARQILGTRKLISNPVGAVHDMLEILGVDLDAKGEACRHCSGVTRITNDLGDARCSGCGRDWAPVSP